jgi:hypothetical protein
MLRVKKYLLIISLIGSVGLEAGGDSDETA